MCENMHLVYVSCCVMLKSTHTVTELNDLFVQYNVHNLLQDFCQEFIAKVQQEPVWLASSFKTLWQSCYCLCVCVYCMHLHMSVRAYEWNKSPQFLSHTGIRHAQHCRALSVAIDISNRKDPSTSASPNKEPVCFTTLADQHAWRKPGSNPITSW